MRVPSLGVPRREASAQISFVRARGPPAYPHFNFEALPQLSDGVRSMGNRRGLRLDQERR